jgi:dTDP-4-amino-4,6-dideoxygalactose transaminase
MQRAGSLGNAGCFSFYPAKNLGGFGDGGMVVTSSAGMRDELLMLRNLGQRQKYLHEVVGFNSRLDTLQAAALGLKLPYLDGWNKSRREAAALYRNALKGLPCVLPEEAPYAEHVWHLFVVRVKERDAALKYLAENGIGAGIHYPDPLHLVPAFSSMGYSKGVFPAAEALSREVLSLPMFPFLAPAETTLVADVLKRFLSR